MSKSVVWNLGDQQTFTATEIGGNSNYLAYVNANYKPIYDKTTLTMTINMYHFENIDKSQADGHVIE